MILGVIRAISENYSHIKGEGSLNKAIFVIDRAGGEINLPKRTTCLKLWGKFKSVAHLGFALVVTSGDGRVRHTREELIKLVSIASDYQKFATSGETPLIHPDEIWGIPDINRVPKADPPVFRLTEGMLRALGEYQAPK